MKYSLKDFTPLIAAFLAVSIGTFILYLFRNTVFGSTYMLASIMMDFMGCFFVVFSVLKMLNWTGFAIAYQKYDLIAKHSKIYAYIYPAIELIIGLLLLTGLYQSYVLILVIFIMGVSSIGVLQKLMKKEEIQCACIGVVFRVPMTWVTLIENLLMIVMAGYMLVSLV